MSVAWTIILDAHLSPSVCGWIEETFKIRCKHVREIGLRDSDDGSIVEQLRRNGGVLMTKDGELTTRVEASGPPPQIIFLTCGNTSNNRLRHILGTGLPRALAALEAGAPIAIISGE